MNDPVLFAANYLKNEGYQIDILDDRIVVFSAGFESFSDIDKGVVKLLLGNKFRSICYAFGQHEIYFTEN